MLPENWRQDPKFGIIAGVLVVLGGGFLIWWMGGDAGTGKVGYLCDNCGHEFLGPSSVLERPACPKCGKPQGVTPNYVMCPNAACPKRRFASFVLRPNEAMMKKEEGGFNEYKGLGQMEWVPDKIPGPGGVLIHNPAADKVRNPAELTCPSCQTKAPGAQFKRGSAYIPQD